MRIQTVKAKLVLGFGTILLLSSVAGFVSLGSLSQVNEQSERLVSDSLVQVNLAQNAKLLLTDIMQLSNKVLLINEDREKQLAVENMRQKMAMLDQTLSAIKTKQGLTATPTIEDTLDANAESSQDEQVITAGGLPGAETEVESVDIVPAETLPDGEVKTIESELDKADIVEYKIIEFDDIWQQYKDLNNRVIEFSLLNSNVVALALSKQGSAQAYDAMAAKLNRQIQLARKQWQHSRRSQLDAQANLDLGMDLQSQFFSLSMTTKDMQIANNINRDTLVSASQVLSQKVDDLVASRGNSEEHVVKIYNAWDQFYQSVLSMNNTNNKADFLQQQISAIDHLTKLSQALVISNTDTLKVGSNQKAQSDERLLIVNRIQKNMMDVLLNERALIASESIDDMQLAIENVEIIELDVSSDLDDLGDLMPIDIVDSIRESIYDYLTVFAKVAKINKENGNVKAFELVVNEGEALTAQAVLLLDDVIAAEAEGMQQQVQDSAEVYTIGRLVVGVLLLGSILIGVGLSWSIIRSMNSGLKQLLNTAASVQSTGDFAVRTELQRNDELGLVANAFDSLLDELQKAINAANQVLVSIAQGDFSERIEDDFKGDLKTLSDGVNRSTESVGYTMQALQEVMHSLAAFDFSARLDDRVSGELKCQVDASMSSMQDAVSEIKGIMKQVSQGDFESRITSDLSGDMADLKLSINLSLDQLQDALRETSEIMARQADGDLSARMQGVFQGVLGDLKDSLNYSSGNLSATMSMVSDKSSSVADMTNRMASASEDISNRIQAQASSLEETAASMEELASTVVGNADYAQQAQTLTQSAVDISQRSNTVVNQAVGAMEQISQSSRQMAEIIELIDSIAFQTNLLALNASVEAARAGEQGRGFAVVAGEVRSLAQKTADASKDIKELIEENISRIQEGSDFVGQSGEAMQQINRSMAEVAEFVDKIARASSEQRSSIQQVSTAVNSMDSLTQQNANSVDQAADTSKLLNTEALKLQQQVDQFKL